MELFLRTLANGIRLVHHTIPGVVAHCGLVINAGSRDEKENEHGIAHFIEHMLFKGTKKRKPYYILSRLEDVGGELNAYTTKEETAIHASFLKGDYERAIELISDIAFNSVFPEKEIVKEKDVVIEEINSYLDNPAELIFDDFEELIFAGQPIGHSILGTTEVVKSFTQRTISDFISRHYSTDQMVFCSVGNISDEKIEKLFVRYFSSVPQNQKANREIRSWPYEPSFVTKKKDTFQNHCIIGNLAYNVKDERRLCMFLLNNILGGQGLNSRLNLSLREKKGLAYNVESSYNPYCDTGVFTIYFGTDNTYLEKSIKVVLSELELLRTRKLGIVQLSKAKNQFKGYLARGYENHESLMLGLGKSILVFGKAESLEETCSKIEKITSSELLETANEVFNPSGLSTLIYK
ncbi:MAG TPA: pitrilysin family protein [Bacteroidales bacterium]|jgi:predicted Zn-dependent peptidase|nr:pitrilysin family protein [Bacteroidales bacterium]